MNKAEWKYHLIDLWAQKFDELHERELISILFKFVCLGVSVLNKKVLNEWMSEVGIWDDCISGWHLDCSCMRDSEPENQAKLCLNSSPTEKMKW